MVRHLLAGRLEASQVGAALHELETIAAELARLPIDQAVTSPHDLARPEIDDALRADAGNLAELFRARDGRLLLDVLRERLSGAAAAGEPVVLAVDGLDVRQARRESGLLLALGIVWAGVALTFAPHAVLTRGTGRHGPLLWALGLAFAAWGALGLLGAARPAYAPRARRGLLLGLLLLGAVVAVSWR